MPTGKSPGIDGLPAEFYLKYRNILGNDLVDDLNNGYIDGKLPMSFRSGKIILL